MRWISSLLISLLIVGGSSLSSIAAEGTGMITGMVEDVSADGMVIVIAGIPIETTPEFIENFFIEVGDRLTITYVEEGDKKRAINAQFPDDDGGMTPLGDYEPMNIETPELPGESYDFEGAAGGEPEQY